MSKNRLLQDFVMPLCLGFALFELPALPAQAKHVKEERPDWPAISQEELAMKDDAANPGAPAVILFRETSTDNVLGYESSYYRIKIFKEDGKKYADVHVPFIKDFIYVEDITARTVHPDGRVVDFDGKVYEKLVVKSKEVKVQTQAFTLPDVQVGSVIEYKYKKRWPASPSSGSWGSYSYFFSSYRGSQSAMRWDIQDELFTRRARFSFRPTPGPRIMWTWNGLPADRRPLVKEGVVQLDLENIPPLEEEEFMPPAEALKARVEFFYIYGYDKQGTSGLPDWYWKEIGDRSCKYWEQFIGKHKGIGREVAAITNAGDPAETKLRKLYARAQQIRNLSYEHEKTEKELKREKIKETQNVEDVLKHGYGYGFEINLLFIAMARAAGFDAYLVLAARRSERFFSRALLDGSQLSATLVEVRIGGKPLYYDPAAVYCPFGLIPWEETGVDAMRLEEESGTWERTPNPVSADAVIERAAALQMDEDGALQGTLQASFVGREALRRRVQERENDETGRRKDLEDEIKEWLPTGAVVELKDPPDWEKSDPKLNAGFSVRIPNFGTSTGRRLLLPLAVFQAGKKYPFRTAKRVHEIYFHYPYQEIDHVTVRLPKGYDVESLPAPRKVDKGSGRYEILRRNEGGELNLERRVVMDGFYFPVQAYSALRIFYDGVRAGDEEQVVLKTVQTAK